MSDGLRLRPATELLRLATLLQASSVGRPMDELLERFEVSRKTMDRRLAAVDQAFPGRLESKTIDGKKYWSLRGGINTGLVGVDATELAALDTAIELLGRGRPDLQHALRDLADKVRALDSGARAQTETDAEALLEGQGIAARPGPRPRIDLAVVEVLREGLLGCLKVRIRYRSRIKREEKDRVVHPYGFLFGGRHYLVAEDAREKGLRLWSLSNVLEAELEEGAYFERDPDFDLRAWASRSFGVFQDEPVDVVWRFLPDAADEAAEYLFHPTQQLEPQPDGSLVVRFHAAGLWEMCWHAFEWRGRVEILEPRALRDEFARMLEAALETQRGAG